MELKFVIPNMAKSLGNLEFGGPAEVKRGDTRRNGTQTKVLYRRYKLFSDVQRADDIEVVIDGAAGQKQFAYMEPVKLKNPSVTAEGLCYQRPRVRGLHSTRGRYGKGVNEKGRYDL